MKILFFLNWPVELCPIVFSGWREFLVGKELSPVRLSCVVAFCSLFCTMLRMNTRALYFE